MFWLTAGECLSCGSLKNTGSFSSVTFTETMSLEGGCARAGCRVVTRWQISVIVRRSTLPSTKASKIISLREGEETTGVSAECTRGRRRWLCVCGKA